MKIRVLFSALILSIAVTLSSIISPIADALPAEPDWVIGEPFIEQSTDGLHSKCANEMRTVVTNKLLYYKEEDMHAKSWCVYTFHEFDIVFYKRLSSTRPLGSDALFDSRGSIESGMAIAYNNGDLTPLDGIDVSLEGLLVYKKDISKLWYMSSCSLITCGLNSLSMYKDNLTQNALTGCYNYNWTSEPLVLKDGTAARGSGFSFSESTEWLSYIVPNTGLVRRNMATGSADVVDAGGSYMVPSYFGSYKPVTSITNDGVYVFAAGPYVNSVVVQSSQRCIVDLMVDITTNPSCRVGYLNPVLVDAIGLSSNGTLQINAVDASGDGSHVRIQMADGRVYYMYPRNSQHLSKMTYLALGDSYSSGEGDIEGGKSSHYLPSTNI